MSSAADARAARLPLLVGVGRADRGDDACGLAVARRYRGPPALRTEESDGEPARLLDLLASADRAWVVDAVRSGAAVGTIHRRDGHAGDVPVPGSGTSTHGLSLGEALALGRALGRLPAELTVYGIEVGSLALGAPLSPPVDGAVDEVVRRIRTEAGRPGRVADEPTEE